MSLLSRFDREEFNRGKDIARPHFLCDPGDGYFLVGFQPTTGGFLPITRRQTRRLPGDANTSLSASLP